MDEIKMTMGFLQETLEVLGGNITPVQQTWRLLRARGRADELLSDWQKEGVSTGYRVRIELPDGSVLCDEGQSAAGTAEDPVDFTLDRTKTEGAIRAHQELSEDDAASTLLSLAVDMAGSSARVKRAAKIINGMVGRTCTVREAVCASILFEAEHVLYVASREKLESFMGLHTADVYNAACAESESVLREMADELCALIRKMRRKQRMGRLKGAIGVTF